MEIPEYNPEITPRIRNEQYWPFAKFIPVLSDTALRILAERGALALGRDIDGEEGIWIKIDNRSYEIPRILTSKKTLSWLGFNKERINELWDTLNKVSPPIITPAVSDGGEWAFWCEIKLWIGDEMYAITKRSADKRDQSWNNEVLNRIGFGNWDRLKPVKIKGEKGLIYTFIQDQKPQDLLPLVQRYVYHRWNLLTQMNKMILHQSSFAGSGDGGVGGGSSGVGGSGGGGGGSHGGSGDGGSGDGGIDCFIRMVEQFDTEPVDLDSIYGRNVNWTRTEWKTPRAPRK